MSGTIDRGIVDRVRSEVISKSGVLDGTRQAWLNDDENVERFIRAEAGNEHKAMKRLVSTLAWMEEERPLELFCPACYEFRRDGDQEDLQASGAGHYMHVVAYDVTNRPTIYSCLELAKNKDIEDNRKHLISTFETAIQIMPPGVRQWNWVLDMHGFRLVDCDPRLARIFLSLASERYPERLGHFWVVDAPSLFSSLWSIIERFIDPKTKEKIRFVKTKGKDESKHELRTALASHFGEAEVDFFVREIAENRKAKRGEKKFCYRDFADRLRFAYTQYEKSSNDCNGGSASTLTQSGQQWSTNFLSDIVRHTGGVMPPRLRTRK